MSMIRSYPTLAPVFASRQKPASIQKVLTVINVFVTYELNGSLKVRKPCLMDHRSQIDCVARI